MADGARPRAATEAPDGADSEDLLPFSSCDPGRSRASTDTMCRSDPNMSLRSSMDSRRKDGRRPSLDYRALIPERTAGDIQKRYDINTDAVAAGGYGKVFIAKDRQSGQKVAIKQVVKQKEATKKAKLLQEVKIMRDLDHPNICKLFETYEKERHMYFVMECCEGGEVFDRIMDLERISEQHCVEIVKQVSSALKYAHAREVAHRDLKPENICFCDKDPQSTQIKVIDWGLGFFFGQARMSSTVGSSTYAAPEVLSARKGEYGAACDLWSLGVLTYVMISGKPPFWGNQNEQLKKMKREQYPIQDSPWDSVSSNAIDFIKNLLKNDPQSRLPIDQVLEHAWFRSTSRREISMPEDNRKQVLANLQQSKNRSTFYSLCVASVAKQLGHDSLRHVHRVFADMDLNGDGVLELHEVKIGFEKLFGKNSPEASQVEEMFKELDLDNSGTIDYTEFCAAGIGEQASQQEDVLWAAFKSFDNSNDDGEISVEELSNVLHSATAVHNSFGKDVCDDVAKELVSKFDSDGNGTISFDEWLQLMQSEQIKHEKEEVQRQSTNASTSQQALLEVIEKAREDGNLEEACEMLRQLNAKSAMRLSANGDSPPAVAHKSSLLHRLADTVERICCCS